MHARHLLNIAPVLVCSAAALFTAGCQQSKQPATAATAPAPPAANDDLAWTRAALERNPTLEIVASDAQSGVFTVRDKRTGGVRAVKASDLAAVPIADLLAPAGNMEGTSATPPAFDEKNSQSAPPGAPSDASSAREPQQQASNQVESGSAGPGVNYTIDRSGGKVKVTGPGISIESSGTHTAAATPDASTQYADDPIICEGQRMLQLDNKTLRVVGDAVIARGGCQLYITNSHIVATGTGVRVYDAIVHISNSIVEGEDGSIQAEPGARLFVRASTFHGVSRRDELASLQDEGGNQWR